MSSINKRLQTGFTLVELLIVAPVAILVVAGLIAIMINLIGDTLIAQQRNTATYEAQDGLNQIEQDVRLSSAILSTTGALTSPQGSDSGTAAFSANGTVNANQSISISGTTALVLREYATTSNPLKSSSSLIYTNSPTSCASGYTANTPLTYMVVYFISGGSLWRRTIVPTGATLCNGPAWQQNSCTTGCATNDRLVASNVSSVNITYYVETASPYTSTIDTSLSATDNPTSVGVNVTTSKAVAGSAIGSSLSIYATRSSDLPSVISTGASGSTNLLPGFATWTLTTGMTYNVSTNELVCTASGGSATSPLISVNSALAGTLQYEGYATTAGPFSYSGVYTGTSYYAANGTTAAYNTDPSPGPYTGNGNAQAMAAPLSAWHSISWTFNLGPAVIYTRVALNCNSAYTSDTHYRNATLTVRWT
jgi:Tfp pilus assembly major pilin PilA